MSFCYSAGTIALLIALYILWQIRSIILLTFTAVALATALNYLVEFLIKLGIPKRGRAILISLALIFSAPV